MVKSGHEFGHALPLPICRLKGGNMKKKKFRKLNTDKACSIFSKAALCGIESTSRLKGAQGLTDFPLAARLKRNASAKWKRRS